MHFHYFYTVARKTTEIHHEETIFYIMTFSILYNTVVLFFLCCSFVVVVIVVENLFFHTAYSDFRFSPVLKDIGLIFLGNNYAIFCRSQIITSSFTKEIML